ncbi:MAG: DEAD/DEAH box helicase [Bacteroidia bacterium]|nr:DEAD/DEAH box helicase [Bacteroidia bacterium]
MEITFNELGLQEPIMQAITDLGFISPTPIQAKVIPVLTSQKTDVVGLAQTGTGKTAAFGLPIVNNIDFNKKNVQALIIAPTRELCLQICNDLKNYSKHISKARVVPVYGGASIEVQIKEIMKGAHIICATPGRMVDLLHRRKVDISQVSVVVLDEADEMLNMGFKEDLDSILEETPDDKNTWLFSATMPEEVSRIARNYMRNPLEVSTGKQNQSAENIEHIYYRIQSSEKYNALRRLVNYYPDLFGIVFCRTKAETQEIASQLIQDGFNADSLHGDLSQHQRDLVMKKFRLKQIKLLIATDVAARGIDVDNITHVIHYNLPEDIDNYTHRSGRTARAGKHGYSISLVGGRDIDRIPALERKLKKSFTKGKIPTGAEVCEKMIQHFITQINNIDASHHIPESIYNQALEILSDLDKEELIKKLISTNFASLIEQYAQAPDLNTGDRKNKTREEGRSNKPFERFFINVGKVDNLNVGELINFVCTALDCEKKNIGRIDLKNSFSFFELEQEFSSHAIRTLSNHELCGRKVRLEKSNPMGGGGSEQSSHGKSVKYDRQEREGSYNRKPKSNFREKSSSSKGRRPERSRGRY